MTEKNDKIVYMETSKWSPKFRHVFLFYYPGSNGKEAADRLAEVHKYLKRHFKKEMWRTKKQWKHEQRRPEGYYQRKNKFRGAAWKKVRLNELEPMGGRGAYWFRVAFEEEKHAMHFKLTWY